MSLLLFSVCGQLGPEKGVMHLAVAAITNALWDLWAKMEGKVQQQCNVIVVGVVLC